VVETDRLAVRNLTFEVDARVPRQWHGAGASVSTFFNALSIFFPVGERFFIASVRAYQGALDGEPFAADVRAFCGQEAVHGREHTRYNAMLRDQGYPVDAMEDSVRRLLDRVTSRARRRVQLAITCALEHFTALLAHALLADPRLLAGAHPTMAALWRWHAAEEAEHKAIAYDVYRSVDGPYLERVIVMAVATVVFSAKIVEHQARLMNADRALFSVRDWGSLFLFLFVRPGGIPAMIVPYLRYYLPGFHPRDIDSQHLIDHWKRHYDEAPIHPRHGASG
jgi:predicted metal-dependent hydrolase